MVLNPLMRFLGVQKLPRRAQLLVQKVVISTLFFDFIWWLSAVFYVLYVIETVGIAQFSILLAISYIVQAVLDYPSGVLGDWLGQRWVLFVGCMLEDIAFGALIFADTFTSLLIVFLIRAIAFSQQSGAVETWSDNNYKVAAGETDPNREVYRHFRGRWNTLTYLISAISLVVGGILVSIFTRQVVFALQTIGMIITALVFLFTVKDYPEIERPKRSVRNYATLMSGGLKFVFRRKVMLFLTMGYCLSMTLRIIWVDLILYPLQLGYTGSDGGASTLRAITLLIVVFIAFYAAKKASKLNIKWYPMLSLELSIFFGGFALLTTWFSIENNAFELVAIIITIIIYAPTRLIYQLSDIIRQRIFLDLIPDQNRNSVYSLIPTLVRIVSTPGIIIGGILLNNLSVSVTLLILGVVGLLAVVLNYIAIQYMPSDALNKQNTNTEL